MGSDVTVQPFLVPTHSECKRCRGRPPVPDGGASERPGLWLWCCVSLGVRPSKGPSQLLVLLP